MKKLLLYILFTSNVAFCQVWNTVGLGIDTLSNSVYSMYTFNNQLCVGYGSFNVNGGTLVSHGFAYWDSTSWFSGNATLTGAPTVYSMETFNGELHIGGSFRSVNGNGHCNKIARWDGVAWQPLSKGVTKSTTSHIRAMASYSGNLFIGGNFIEVDSNIPVGRIARWDGAQWHAMGTGFSSAFGIWSMQVYNNELFVGGEFNAIDGVPANNICRWNGSNWDSLGAGVDGIVMCMIVDTVNNKLYIGGEFFNVNGIPAPCNVAVWDGNTLMPINASPYLFPHGMAMYDGKLFAAGGSNGLVNNLGDTIHNLAYFDGTNWQPACFQIDATVQAMREYKNELYVGGNFDSINNIPMYGIARYYNAAVTVVENEKESYYITVIPNPASQQITLSFTRSLFSAATIRMFNLLGEQVYEQPAFIQKQISIPVYQLPSGIYILEVSYEGKKERLKFVRE